MGDPGRLGRLGAVLLLVAASCRAGGDERPPDEAPAEETEGWRVLAADDPRGLLLSVWGDGAGGAYLAGGDGGRTTILRFDGRTLRAEDNPGDRLAWWGFGVDGEVFVVGERGLLLRRSGVTGRWALEPAPTQATLFGVWGASADDLWLVGGSFPDGSAVLLHGGPEGVREVALPAGLEGRHALFKVWGSARDDVHAVGEGGVVLHYDGVAWSRVPTPGAADLLTVSGRGAQDVWAVGGRARGVVWHYDGARWRDVTPLEPALPGLNGVFAGAGLAAQVVGDLGAQVVGSSRVDLQACKLEYSIVSPK